LRLEHLDCDEREPESFLSKTLATGDVGDPAVAVELRDKLRELAEARGRRRRTKPAGSAGAGRSSPLFG
jgi:hypothetical protein